MKQAILVVMLALFSSVVVAGDAGIVKLKSKYSVDETMDRVEKTAISQGMRIWAREDFKKMGDKIDVNIKPTQIVIFGKGRAGPKLIASSPTVALDLPLRVISWEDKSGQVWVAYTTADYLKDRHNIQGKDKVVGKVNGRLKSITSEALK